MGRQPGDMALSTPRPSPMDGAGSALRETIRLSWMRSRLASAPTDRINIPYREDDGAAERLVRAAAPILDRFAEQLADTNVSLVLADRNARVVGRWAADRKALSRLSRVSIEEGFVLAEDLAGTNGIGTVLEAMVPVTIFGAEHYSEPLQRLVCVGVPIRHPLTRRIEGVVDLSCPTNEASNLMMPTLLELSSQIERELSARSSLRERVVFDAFLARSRITSAALVGLAEQFMVTSAAAADLLESRDQRLLWEQTKLGGSGRMRVELASGMVVSARRDEIVMGSTLAGALLEFSTEPKRPTKGFTRSPAPLTPHHPDQESGVDKSAGLLTIMGESGSGKSARAQQVHETMRPDEPLSIHPSGLALVEGATPWLRRLQARLSDVRGTVVISDVEVLDDALSQSVSDLLAARPGIDPLVIVTRSTDRGHALTGLQQGLGHPIEQVPPLRQRRDELSDLAYDILRATGMTSRVGNRAMAALINYSWPGNLPQLRQVLLDAARLADGGAIGIEHLSEEVRATGRGRRQLTRIEAREREVIVDALREHDGNRVKAATALGLSRSTLYRRLRFYGLDTSRTLI
jgi:transcriptional regulator of acetoin/glycerol metabolism